MFGEGIHLGGGLRASGSYKGKHRIRGRDHDELSETRRFKGRQGHHSVRKLGHAMKNEGASFKGDLQGLAQRVEEFGEFVKNANSEDVRAELANRMTHKAEFLQGRLQAYEGFEDNKALSKADALLSEALQILGGGFSSIEPSPMNTGSDLSGLLGDLATTTTKLQSTLGGIGDPTGSITDSSAIGGVDATTATTAVTNTEPYIDITTVDGWIEQWDPNIELKGTSYLVENHEPEHMLDVGTVAVTFNAVRPDGRRGIVSKEAAKFGDGGHLTIFQVNNTIEVRLESTTESYTLTGGTFATGEDVHVAVSFGDQGMQLYVNGEMVDSNTYTGGLGLTSGGTGNINDWVFGADASISAEGYNTHLRNYFVGTISEVSLFDRQLSTQEIQDHQNGLLGLVDPNAPAAGEVVSQELSQLNDVLNNPDLTAEEKSLQAQTQIKDIIAYIDNVDSTDTSYSELQGVRAALTDHLGSLESYEEPAPIPQEPAAPVLKRGSLVKAGRKIVKAAAYMAVGFSQEFGETDDLRGDRKVSRNVIYKRHHGHDKGHKGGVSMSFHDASTQSHMLRGIAAYKKAGKFR